MRMMNKIESSPEDLETVKVSRLPTTVSTANGSIDTTEEATVYVKDLDMFATVQLHEDTPAVFYLGTLRRKLGIHVSGKKVKTKSHHTITSCLSSFLVFQAKHILRVQLKIQLETLRS